MPFELTYPDKASPEQVLEETPRVSLHKVTSFGESAWQNQIIFGDNLSALRTLIDEKEQGKLKNDDGSSGVRLIYIDPPFGTGDAYGRNHSHAYSAKRTGADYLEWLRRRVILLRELLSDDGSFYMRTDYHFGHHMRILLDEIFGSKGFRNEIIINRTKKVFDGISRFNTATDTLFFYTRSGDYIFHGAQKPRKQQKWIAMHSPGIRWSPVDKKQLKHYNDDQLEERRGTIRSRGRVYDGKIIIPPDGRHWTFSQERMERYREEGRIRMNPKTGIPEYQTAKEERVDSNWTDIPGYSFKWGYPTENSEQLLERVISASSNPGDLVLDAFSGSGTTAAVAEKLGRRWVMLDSSKTSLFVTTHRMLHLKEKIGNRGKHLEPAPFAVYHAFTEEHSEPDWELYCRATKTLFGVDDSKLRDNPVIYFDWRQEINQLNRQVAKKLASEVKSDLVYIIVPTRFSEWLADSYLFDSCEAQLLKVPESIMSALADPAGPFSGGKMPDRNRLVHSIAFDLVMPPTVNCDWQLNDEDVICRINNFETNAITKKPLGKKKSGLNALAFITVDPSFDGSIFRPQFTWESKSLQDHDYKLPFPEVDSQSDILISFTDIFGNEKRELVDLSQLTKTIS